MQPLGLAAVACLLLGGGALLVGTWALADAQDLVGFYWLFTGAVTLVASLQLARRRGS